MSDNPAQAEASPETWRDALYDRIPEQLGREIEVFEGQIHQKRDGKLRDEVFAEMRLRKGVYGQRYDNGRRDDGTRVRELRFPNDGLFKGPDTHWDAPGMVRIKVPFGAMTTAQMDVLAEVAEEYSDGILHVTTRQDIQLHFVHLEDTPDLMRRLAAVGITTQEACGNVVRNVTACHLAGVCTTETFDVTRYADAATRFLLGHPDTQEFGRKVKLAFSGCAHLACGLAKMHDIGGIARIRSVDGRELRGFEFYVGGGLGAVPHQAKLFDEFLPEEELLPTCQAIARVFARLGEKTARARARLKFLVAKLGLEEFKRLVLEERAKLGDDPRWTAFLAHVHGEYDGPLAQLTNGRHVDRTPATEASAGTFTDWLGGNTLRQKQGGYRVVVVTVPLGDLTSVQMRGLARVARRFTGDAVRATVEQNLAFRWVREADLPAIYEALGEVGLNDAHAGTIADITSCPGTDTCKLGISASRGLARVLMDRFGNTVADLDERVRNLNVKISGCFNSCGQHHVADIGFFGVSRRIGGYHVPHFQVVLGGQWGENAGAYGLAVVAVPSKHVPTALDRITALFVQEGAQDDSFQAFVARLGKPRFRALLEDLRTIPEHEDAPDFYSDWGDPREYSIGDMGVGECAGQVVTPVEFGLQAAERELYEAQDRFDQGDSGGAADIAYGAMLLAARSLARDLDETLGEAPDEVVQAFRTHLWDTKRFHDRFAGGKFGNYLFRTHTERGNGSETNPERARQSVEEAQLFIEAAYSCHGRMLEEAAV